MTSQTPLFQETLASTIDRVMMGRYSCLCLSFPTYKEILLPYGVLKVIHAPCWQSLLAMSDPRHMPCGHQSLVDDPTKALGDVHTTRPHHQVLLCLSSLNGAN